MGYKKGLIFICLIICLFSIASVVASDVKESMVADDNQMSDDEILVVEEQEVDEVGASEEYELSSSSGTFTDLAYDIANANDELNLTKSYSYNANDTEYKKGIIIDKKIIINGNGFSLTANNALVFKILSNNVTLNNISFENCYSSEEGSVIYWEGVNGTLNNCRFIDCYSTKSSLSKGGSIYWNGVNGTLTNCNFENCHSSDNGGAVYWNGVNGTLTNCNFENCYAKHSNSNSRYGGAIYWNSDDGILYNCSFLKCYISSSGDPVSHRGGAIYWKGNNGILYNCSFERCYIPQVSRASYGGAIEWWGLNGILYNSSFIKCSALSSSSSSDGGAIHWYGSKGILYNCNFINCSASSKNSDSNGGAIYWMGSYSLLNNCNFINCDVGNVSVSKSRGGAIFWYGSYGNVSNSSFEGSCISTVYWFSSYGTLIDSNFNTSTNEWDVYWYGSNGKIIDCNCSKVYKNNDCQVLKRPFIKLNIAEKIHVGDILPLNYLINANATGSIKIYINDSFEKEIDINDNYIFYDLKSGKYIIKIIYSGNNYYTAGENSTEIIVSKINCFNVEIPEVIVNENNTFSFDLPSNAKGNVTLTINNNNYPSNVINGNINIGLSNLPNGTYEYTIIYSGDEKYYSFTKNGTLTVGIIETIISEDMISEYGSEYEFNATFLNGDGTPLAEKYVIFEVNGTPYTVKTDSKGVAYLNIGLTNGRYNITSINQFTDESKNNNLTIIGDPQPVKKTIIEANDIIMNYGDEKYLIATLKNQLSDEIIDGVELEIVLNGTTSKKITENGQVKLLINLTPNTYQAVISFKGNEYYKPSTKIINIMINDTKIEPEIIIPPLDYPSAEGSVTIILPQGATGTVTLVIDNKPYSFPVQNGVAKIYMPELANGNYPYTITYSGDGKYSSFTKTGKVTVNKPAPKPATKTTLTLKKVTVKRSAKKLNIQATLKINGKAVKGKIIKFKFNKKTYNAKTNAKGVAKITVKKSILKKLKKGKKVTYTATYGKITKKVTVKVKK